MTPSPEIQRQFLIECIATDLAHILIEEQGYDMNHALDVIYNSDTFQKLENPKTCLYYQSTTYLCDMLEEELASSTI